MTVGPPVWGDPRGDGAVFVKCKDPDCRCQARTDLREPLRPAVFVKPKPVEASKL